MHDLIFKNQRELDDWELVGYAARIGVDMNTWESCYRSNKYAKRIQADQYTAVKLGARGTPAFFINGRFLSGAQPLPAFEFLIDEELKKAKASGIPAKDYYRKAVVGKGKESM